jgi:putative transposase
VLERAPSEEPTKHLGYDRHDLADRRSGNSRNGSPPKRLLTEDGSVDLQVPRDRAGSLDAHIVRMGQHRLDGTQDRHAHSHGPSGVPRVAVRRLGRG